MRLLLTLLAIGIALAFCLAFFLRGDITPPPTPMPADPTASVATDPATPNALTDPSPTPAKDGLPSETAGPEDPTLSKATPVTPAVNPITAPIIGQAPAQSLTPPSPDAVMTKPSKLEVRVKPAPEAQVSRVGSLDPDSGYQVEAELTGWGAGVRHIRLVDYSETASGTEPYIIQRPIEAKRPSDGVIERHYPFAARYIFVNGQRIELATQPWQLVRPGVYQIDLVDADGHEVLRITRQYQVKKQQEGYDLRCEQRIENRCDRSLNVVWEQYAQGDVPQDLTSYLGDRRMLVAGYHNYDYNPTGKFIYTDDTFLWRSEILDEIAPAPTKSITTTSLEPLWPNEDLPQQRDLVWLASLNRYFAAVVYPVPTAQSRPEASPTAWPSLDGLFPHQGMVVIGDRPSRSEDHRTLALTLRSRPFDLAPGQTEALDLALYAGPRKTEVFEAPAYQGLNFSKLVVYSLGGPCAFCTFQWLARGLLWFLKGLHWVVNDWGVSIIILVLIVRGLLHPITKKAQINMMKMGKQMQTIQPELEKLKKKYGSDTQAFQREQVKLWREKGINPAGMLGCLPMFLQTPLWIALYAMLYFAIELRHQPAFYGVFQSISGGAWGFLNDLSSADHFIRFSGDGFKLPLIFINPTVSGINVLPLLMAVVFYFQQKLTTPPPATEQAAQQQKIMRFTVFIFPVMLYAAPSGLTLYILASTLGGVVDSYFVRKHIKQEEEAGRLFDKKPVKPGSLRDRLNRIVETTTQEMMSRQARAEGPDKQAPSKRRKRR